MSWVHGSFIKGRNESMYSSFLFLSISSFKIRFFRFHVFNMPTAPYRKHTANDTLNIYTKIEKGTKNILIANTISKNAKKLK